MFAEVDFEKFSLREESSKCNLLQELKEIFNWSKQGKLFTNSREQLEF